MLQGSESLRLQASRKMVSSSCQQCQLVCFKPTLMVVLFAAAYIAGAETASFQLYNKTRGVFAARMGRSSLWDRETPPIDRHLSFFPVDTMDEEAAKAAREDRDITDYYRSLCQVNRVLKEIKEDGYVFQPQYYHEITCKDTSKEFAVPPKPNQCGYPLLCVQRFRELFVMRKVYGGSCWETVSMVVPSNCECMWPERRFGDLE